MQLPVSRGDQLLHNNSIIYRPEIMIAWIELIEPAVVHSGCGVVRLMHSGLKYSGESSGSESALNFLSQESITILSILSKASCQ